MKNAIIRQPNPSITTYFSFKNAIIRQPNPSITTYFSFKNAIIRQPNPSITNYFSFKNAIIRQPNTSISTYFSFKGSVPRDFRPPLCSWQTGWGVFKFGFDFAEIFYHKVVSVNFLNKSTFYTSNLFLSWWMCSPLKGCLLIVPFKATKDK